MRRQLKSKINALVVARTILLNARYFAVTPTGKDKTLEISGGKREDGKFHTHHIYSIRQAIEEAVILF